ncbi:hypothetical protein L2E82_31906 [Cichorium intybus]|uniref:Uncharacterized protein n=1 Tax=Cichorium intybus TaxID=13427 RepID=A0ACB9BEI7_CICIN|nr:hypothetical protein L2E82_31906 [Cichorium intybus]
MAKINLKLAASQIWIWLPIFVCLFECEQVPVPGMNRVPIWLSGCLDVRILPYYYNFKQRKSALKNQPLIPTYCFMM